MNDLVLLIMALAFLIVSLVFAGKLLLEAYLEYIQVREGIEVIRTSMEEALLEEEDDDPRS